jgi:hypothetical protein
VSGHVVQNEEINLVKTRGESNNTGIENTDPLLSGNQNICVVTKISKKILAAAPVSKVYIFHIHSISGIRSTLAFRRFIIITWSDIFFIYFWV